MKRCARIDNKAQNKKAKTAENVERVTKTD